VSSRSRSRRPVVVQPEQNPAVLDASVEPHVGESGASWLKGYKLRRLCVKQGSELVASVDLLAASGDLPLERVEFFVDSLCEWARRIEQDLLDARASLLGLPTWMQAGRLDAWDATLGVERLGWTVCVQKLSASASGLAWSDAAAAWNRACAIRAGRAPIHSPGVARVSKRRHPPRPR